MSEQLLQQILTELQSSNQRLERLEVEQQNVRQAVLEIGETVGRLESDVSTMKVNMATKDDISLLPLIKQSVLETNRNVLESSATIGRIEESQLRQDRILESLSMRSLEQETELRELKRVK